MGQFDTNFTLPGVRQPLERLVAPPDASLQERQSIDAYNKNLDDLERSFATTDKMLQSGTTSFTMSGVTTKINEAESSVVGTFGSSGPFDKLGANLPSFDSLAASTMKAGSNLVGNVVSGITGSVSSLFGGNASGVIASKVGAIQNGSNSAVSASMAKGVAGVSTVTSDHKVRLTDGKTIITFEVMPEIVEAHTIGYEAVAPAQFPGAFQKYKGSDSVTWTLNIQLISRTRDEATENYDRLNTLRGWKQPFFGQTTGNNFPKMLGAPPPVLTLRGLRDLVGPVPVVITSLNWTWPKDVDYLPTNQKGSDGNPIPFPAVMTIAITMVESYSTRQFNQFDLRAYREGKMHAAFNEKIIPIERGDEGE